MLVDGNHFREWWYSSNRAHCNKNLDWFTWRRVIASVNNGEGEPNGTSYTFKCEDLVNGHHFGWLTIYYWDSPMEAMMNLI